MKAVSTSKAQTQRLAAEFAKTIVCPAVIGLFGDLGAGKTTFVQGLARGLKIDPDHYVNSPTFTLVNEYLGRVIRLVHVDLYRIEKSIEVETLALEEYLVPGTIVVIEWAERLPESLRRLDFQVRFKVISDREREIEITSPRLRHPSPE